MRRIYPAFAYGPGPRAGCWWDETIAAPDWPVLQGDVQADVAIVGGGFTGMSAALHLAEAGVSVALLEAETPGWGASGRNGGFCCLGGARLSDAKMAARYGAADTRAYRYAELAAVALVDRLLTRLDIDADRHSHGETQLAHNRRAWDRMRRAVEAWNATRNTAEGRDDTGARPVLTEPGDLNSEGMAGPFFGAITTPVGFGLNPRKYLFGLAAAARRAGAALFQRSAARSISRTGARWTVAAAQGQVSCDTVIVATNGYSSEDLPGWLGGRYMPTQSAVLVTRPISDAELAAQGWTSDQMAYDSRNLLHYFRLMPDRRFLFGMRGGLLSSARAERAVLARVRRDFEAMFPAWKGVASDHSWSGLVCLSRNRVPFAGPVPGNPGMFAGLAYHGNGVAMGSYAGRQLAELVQGRDPGPALPAPMRDPLARFPLGSARRVLLPPLYAALKLGDL